MARRGIFQKSAIEILYFWAAFGRIMQMKDLLNDKFNTQNDSGCG
jgi:hypothetical protein